MKFRLNLHKNSWLKAVSFGFFIVTMMLYLLVYRKTINQTEAEKVTVKNNIEKNILDIKNKVDKELSAYVKLTDNVKTKIEKIIQDTKSLLQKEKEILEILNSKVEVNPEIASLGLIFKEFGFDPSKRLYAPFIYQGEKSPWQVNIEEYYDYTKFDWYQEQVKFGEQSAWSSPSHVSQIENYPFIQSIQGIKGNNGKTIAFIVLRIKKDNIKNLLNKNKPVDSSFVELIDNQGLKMVSHGSVTKNDKAENPYETIIHTNYNNQEFNSKSAFKGFEEKNIRSFNKVSFVTYYYKIQNNNLYLKFFIEEDSFTESPADLNFSEVDYNNVGFLVWCYITFITFLLSFAYFRQNKVVLTVMSIVSTLVFARATFELWSIISKDNTSLKKNILSIQSYEKEVTKSKEDYTFDLLQNKDKIPLYIPTGVSLIEIKDKSSTEISLVGFIWQRYHRILHKGIERKIVFPNALNVKLKKAYEDKGKYTDTIAWNFEVTLKAKGASRYYPFDFQLISLEAWHSEFLNDVILTPDLNSYNYNGPRFIPGIEEGFQSTNWNIEFTGFEKKLQPQTTSYGARLEKKRDSRLSLTYALGLKRRLIGPFLRNMFPTIIVYILLFILLIMATREKRKRTKENYTVMNESIALFFVTVLIHIQLMSTVTSDTITYFDLSYFSAYMFIIWIPGFITYMNYSKSETLYSEEVHFRILSSYWPIVVLTLFWGTYYFFA